MYTLVCVFTFMYKIYVFLAPTHISPTKPIPTVKANLGLHHTKMCITSAAPIAVEVLEYFASLDIPILELFGQSECTGPHTSNFSYAWKIGSIGRDVRACVRGDGGVCVCLY